MRSFAYRRKQVVVRFRMRQARRVRSRLIVQVKGRVMRVRVDVASSKLLFQSEDALQSD
jgi:hypothetical protein